MNVYKMFCRCRDSLTLFALILIQLLFVPFTIGLPVATQCRGYDSGAAPAVWKGFLEIPTNNIHQSRMCRPFQVGTTRQEVFLDPNPPNPLPDPYYKEWEDPCLKFEFYPAGKYRDQIGISVSYNLDPTERRRCEQQQNYQIFRITMMGVSTNGYPVGRFVPPSRPATSTPIQYTTKQFYYDTDGNTANIGNRDLGCQVYTDPPGRGKHCTCLDGNKKDPRRPWFNNDALYPPLEIVECPRANPPNADPAYRLEGIYYPRPNMIELDMTRHPLLPGYDARENDGNDYSNSNFGFDVMFYHHLKEYSVEPGVYQMPDRFLSFFIEVHLSVNGKETVTNYYAGRFSYESIRFPINPAPNSNPKYNGTATRILFSMCGELDFQLRPTASANDLNDFQFEDKFQDDVVSSYEITLPYVQTAATTTPYEVSFSSMDPNWASTTTTTRKPVPVTVKTPIPTLQQLDTDKSDPTFSSTTETAIAADSAEVLERKEIFEICKWTRACLSGTLLPRDKVVRVETERVIDQGCVTGQTCEVMLMYGQQREGTPEGRNDEVVLELYGKSRFWVAVGFSDDLRMREDFVVECVWEGGDSQNVKIYTSRNNWDNLKGNQRSNKRFVRHTVVWTQNEPQSSYVRPISTNRTNEFIWCIFAMKRRVNLLSPNDLAPGSNRRPVTTLDRYAFYLLFAKGSEEGSRKGYDSNTEGLKPGHFGDRYLYKNRTNLGQKFGPDPRQESLMFAHGHVMILAWMFFLPISNFIGRYYKETYVNVTVPVLGCRLWIFLHATFASVGLFFVCFGFGLLTFAKSDWDYVGGARPTVHLWSGVAAASIYASNVYGAVFFEGRDPNVKIHYSELIHGFFGHATLIAATVALDTANKVYYSFAPCSISYVVRVWIIVYFIFHIVMSFHYLWVDWVLGLTSRIYWSCATFTTRTLFQPYNQGRTQDAPGTKVRTIILIAFVIVQAVFAALTSWLYKYSNNTDRCYEPDDFQQFVYT